MPRGKNKRVKSNKRKVPEKVTERRDANKEKFLLKLEEMPVIQVASAYTGVHRSTYYRWYKEDDEFKEKADTALKSGIGLVNDMMESMLIKLGREGKITPIIFWLKHNHDSYMPVQRYEHFHRHEFKNQPMTEERKQQIAEVMKLWSEPIKEDERDEDYDGSDDDVEYVSKK